MTEAPTLTLTDFLLARLAEDEAYAKAATPGPWDYEGTYSEGTIGPARERRGIAHASWEWRQSESEPDFMHIARHDPARVLAEVEAKRRVVTLMGYVRESWDNKHSGDGRVMWPDVTRREKSHALTILENLATPYADHPDYREEWRP